MQGPTGTVLLRLALVAAAFLAGGCSDDPPKAGRLPSDSPSPTTSSASPSPSTPEEQIEAAVRAYYAELTRAAQTNDTSVLRTMTTQGCPCYRSVRVIDRNRRQGEKTPDARFDVTSIRVHDVEASAGLAEVTAVAAAYPVVDGDGKVVDRVAEQKMHLDLSLSRTSSGDWIIGNWFNLGGA